MLLQAIVERPAAGDVHRLNSTTMTSAERCGSCRARSSGVEEAAARALVLYRTMGSAQSKEYTINALTDGIKLLLHDESIVREALAAN